MSSQPERRFKPEPVETTTRSSRRFAPQPVETTIRSTKKPAAVPEQKPARRRFYPEPIETSASSSRDKPSTHGEAGTTTTAPKSRFRPQLLESSVQRRRNSATASSSLEKDVEPSPMIDSSPAPSIASSAASSTSSARRRFAPQLLETASRSRRAGDKRPALLQSDKTDVIPAHRSRPPLPRAESHPVPTPPVNSPVAGLRRVLSTREARRLGIPLPQRQYSLREPTRTHSFRIPELEPIESSESEETEISTSPSSSSDLSALQDATRRRESVDASGYLLELAAKAAERLLREQALAAFPNDDRHTPVDHFIGRDSEETSTQPSRRGTGFRRDSGQMRTDLQYLEMRRHQEKLEAQREKEKQEREARRRRAARQSDDNPWVNPFLREMQANRDLIGGWEKDKELERMRKQARPPMLGQDLTFPRCQSPEPARFDVTQGSQALRNSMCYLTEQSETSPHEPETGGLWCSPKKETAGVVSLWSRASSRSPSPGGLWGGFCCQENAALQPPSGPTGIMTPRVDDENPLDLARGNQLLRNLPPSPPPSNSGMTSLDEKLETETAIEEEFNDAFITQVYNYLSLGYPSLARKYDEELSKISRIPLSELRQDDHLPTSQGYIRLGEDENAKNDGITEEQCCRWKALKLYVHEWARQQPFMAEDNNRQGGFGVAIRRGSWAW
jgi:hypothetical protein